MRKREAANRTLPWLILAACLALVFGLWRLFWAEASDGRGDREVERIESAQDRIIDGAPLPDGPVAPQTP